jgi:hypothetical protein
MSYISQKLIEYTCENSNFETSRNYISLSKIGSSIDELISDYRNGFQDNPAIRLKCYKGYQMEHDLKARLFKIFPLHMTDGQEISIEGGLIKGHPDFQWDGDPGDCKSVLKDEWIPQDIHLIPRRIIYQIQAYILYTKRTRGLLIFESRETGLIRDFWINSNTEIMNEIKMKVDRIIGFKFNK